ncbi:MAG: efflux RND transporter periplasmic adaptor subunit [Planctomycetota bacterium]
MFENQSPREATRTCLEVIAKFYDAVYIALHARIGVNLLSEEWTNDEFDPPDALREIINNTLIEAMTDGKAKCVRLGRDGEAAHGVLASVIYDEDLEGSGGACLVLGQTSREEAMEALSIFEGVTGFIGLLIANKSDIVRRDAGEMKGAAVQATTLAYESNDDPVRIAFGMVTQMRNRYGYDQAAIGYVRENRVSVVAISGFDDVRAANPGVKLIRQAMEECLDREELVLHHGHLVPEDTEPEDDCRLHAQWSRSVGGDSVASFPIIFNEEIVAVASLRRSVTEGLEPEKLEELMAAMAGYGPLIALSRRASRTFLRHMADNCRATVKQLIGERRRKSLTWGIGLLLLLLWFFFGTVSYSLTFPCRVTAADLKMISSPREGVLKEVRVLQGDRVAQGDVLAVLDFEEYVLQESELSAQVASLEGMGDEALAEGKATERRVLESRLRSAKARLELVQLRIAQSKIRASVAGLVLEGDLRQRVGAWIAMGEPLFEIAADDRVRVEIEIPESSVLEARDSQRVVFVPAALPGLQIALSDIVIPPASTIVDHKHVFKSRTTAFDKPGRLSPGMAGFASLEIGERSVWWVATHHILDWMRMRFWL